MVVKGKMQGRVKVLSFIVRVKMNNSFTKNMALNFIRKLEANIVQTPNCGFGNYELANATRLYQKF